MTGRKVCIRNDWRVGDVLENKRHHQVIITAIGVDYVLVYRKAFENEIYTRLDEVDADWKLVFRPRKFIGWRVVYGNKNHGSTYQTKELAEHYRDLFLKDYPKGKCKVVKVYKTASKTK